MPQLAAPIAILRFDRTRSSVRRQRPTLILDQAAKIARRCDRTSAKRHSSPSRWLGLLVTAALVVGCAGDGPGRPSMTISECMQPARAASGDIRRNLGRIERAPLCYRRQQVHEAGFRWTLHILEHREHPQGPFWVLPHDDENTAFDVAVQAVIDYGGGLLAVDSDGQRRYLGQDPNRNFSRTRAESRLCRGQHRPSPGYSQAVLDHYRGRRGPILALHNNRDGWSGNGGAGTISLERESATLRAYPGVRSGTNRVAYPSHAGVSSRLRDEDNLIFVVGSGPLSADPALQRRVAALNAAGLNVMHKQLNNTNFDCSLSDYVARHRLGEYYNIEAEHGDRQTQQQMVERLLQVLGIPPLGAPRSTSPFLNF